MTRNNRPKAAEAMQRRGRIAGSPRQRINRHMFKKSTHVYKKTGGHKIWRKRRWGYG